MRLTLMSHSSLPRSVHSVGNAAQEMTISTTSEQMTNTGLRTSSWPASFQMLPDVSPRSVGSARSAGACRG